MIIEPGDPEQEFFVGYRELFEKPDRLGYTKYPSKAGRFNLDQARAMTKHTCSGGYGRWYIAVEVFESFDGKKTNPK